MPLNAPRRANSDIIILHHGWRKFWNSMLLDGPRLTNFDIIYLHDGWRKFWNSTPLDASRMTSFDIHIRHGWGRFSKFQGLFSRFLSKKRYLNKIFKVALSNFKVFKDLYTPCCFITATYWGQSFPHQTWNTKYFSIPTMLPSVLLGLLIVFINLLKEKVVKS